MLICCSQPGCADILGIPNTTSAIDGGDSTSSDADLQVDAMLASCADPRRVNIGGTATSGLQGDTSDESDSHTSLACRASQNGNPDELWIVQVGSAADFRVSVATTGWSAIP